jgi:hypothetical protein
VCLGLRRLSGIMDGSFFSVSEVESMSRDERPRCSVRAFAAARRAGGVIYGRGKCWMEEYIGRVVVV